ncbi:hypothetical protein H7X69_01525, partial [Candidatus Saccharibacteria bacterium]|nr:hypothetical protein [Candidatus Saccharibacteria bacterium]
KKAITIISLIGALLIILDSVQASHWFVLFLLAGVIPGTDILIPAAVVLAANAAAITIVFLRLAVWPNVQSLFFPEDTTAIATNRPTPNRVG